MKIYFDVKNQIITRTDRNQVIANSADYLEAEITFSAEWATMEKTMTFKNGNLLYTYVLVNDKILEENHLNLGVGTWKVSIQGVNEDKKIVTNECNLAVNASGWIGSEALPPESIWNQLLVIIQSLHTEAASTAALRSAVQKYIEDNYDALVKEAVIVDDVRAALDDMAEDGTLSDLLAPLVAAGMPEVVADQISAVVAAQIGGVVANQIGAVVASQITTPVNQAVKNYCDDNFSGWSGALDRGLAQPLMAAPADMVGEIKSALSELSNDKQGYVLKAYLNAGIITENNNYRMLIVPCLPNKKYKVTKILSSRFNLSYTKGYAGIGASLYGAVVGNDKTELEITTGADAEYLCVVYYINTDTDTESTIYNSITITSDVANPKTAKDTTNLFRFFSGSAVNNTDKGVSVSYSGDTVTGSMTNANTNADIRYTYDKISPFLKVGHKYRMSATATITSGAAKLALRNSGFNVLSGSEILTTSGDLSFEFIFGENNLISLFVTTTSATGNVTFSNISIEECEHQTEYFIASSNALAWEKEQADIVCDGTNDQFVIKSVMDAIARTSGVGTIRLSSGSFYVTKMDENSDAEGYCVFKINNLTNLVSITFKGCTMPLNNAATCIEVTDDAYDACDNNTTYRLFGGTPIETSSSKNAISMEDICIFLPWNQKKIICVDVAYFQRCYLQRMDIRAFNNHNVYHDGYLIQRVHGSMPPLAVEGCIGVRGCTGSNAGAIEDFRNISCCAFYHGFEINGEHIIGINLAALYGVYGFVFGAFHYGNAPTSNFAVHPITLINCSDEMNYNYPLFVKSGNYQDGGRQRVTLLDFNMERYDSLVPGGGFAYGDYAICENDDNFRGEINYSIKTRSKDNDVTAQFWADGKGHTFKSVNSAQLISCDSATRKSYKPCYLQKIFDTTIGKEVICIDEVDGVWVDALGDVVD